jgi:hypothetical protein
LIGGRRGPYHRRVRMPHLAIFTFLLLLGLMFACAIG